MSDLEWRLTKLEEDVRDLKRGQPDVIAERVQTLSRRVDELKKEVNEDVADLRSDVKGVRRILLGFLSGVTLVVLAAVLTIVLAQ